MMDKHLVVAVCFVILMLWGGCGDGSLRPLRAGEQVRHDSARIVDSDFPLWAKPGTDRVDLHWASKFDGDVSFAVYRSSLFFESVLVSSDENDAFVIPSSVSALAIVTDSQYADKTTAHGAVYYYQVIALAPDQTVIGWSIVDESDARKSDGNTTGTTETPNETPNETSHDPSPPLWHPQNMIYTVAIPTLSDGFPYWVTVSIRNDGVEPVTAVASLALYSNSPGGNAYRGFQINISLSPQQSTTVTAIVPSALCPGALYEEVRVSLRWYDVQNGRFIKSDDLGTFRLDVVLGGIGAVSSVYPRYVTMWTMSGWTPVSYLWGQGSSFSSLYTTWYYSLQYGYSFPAGKMYPLKITGLSSRLPLDVRLFSHSGVQCWRSDFRWDASWNGVTHVSFVQDYAYTPTQPELFSLDVSKAWDGTANLLTNWGTVDVPIASVPVAVTVEVGVNTDIFSGYVSATTEYGSWEIGLWDDAIGARWPVTQVAAGGGMVAAKTDMPLPCNTAAGWVTGAWTMTLEDGSGHSWFGSPVTGFYLPVTLDAWEPDTSPADAQLLTTAPVVLSRSMWEPIFSDGRFDSGKDVDWFRVTGVTGVQLIGIEAGEKYGLVLEAGLYDSASVSTYPNGNGGRILTFPQYSMVVAARERRYLLLDGNVDSDWVLAVHRPLYGSGGWADYWVSPDPFDGRCLVSSYRVIMP